MKQILVVEDNPVLLELYGMILASESERWKTTLASGGEAAMKLLGETRFDVVVSDMQMPGMDGLQLLAEVRKMHPETSRIIVSGYADQAVAADSLNSTHLFISKPFDAKTLRSALSRIGSLDAYLKDDKLRGLAGKMRSMPSFPTVYIEIMKEIESPNSSIQCIAELIAKDPAILAKVLQVANSAALGLAERVNDPAEAVHYLGMRTVRSLTLSAQVYRNFAPGRLKSFSADALWGHLMKCGELARQILRKERAQASELEEAFTAGMLHDMGKLMLADGLPEEFGEAMALAKDTKVSLARAEQQVFGATHAGLAAYLLGLWGLPAAIVEAVAFHDAPEKSDLKTVSALTAVHVANALCDEADSLNMDYLRELGVENRVEDWKELAVELMAA